MTQEEKREDAAQEPRIESRGAFRLVGTYYAGKNEHNEIPALWDNDFIPRIRELVPDPSEGFVCYGACRMPAEPDNFEPGAFEYLASVEMPPAQGVPEGMTAWEVPAQTYAVLRARGIPEIPRVFEYLYGVWARESTEWEPVDGPCFELYPQSFPDDETVDIYIPVGKR